MSIVYLIFILLAAYFSYRYDGIEETDPHKNHRYWLLCIYLICLSGFSYGLGGDKQVYMESFEIMDPALSFPETMYYSLLFQGYMPGWSTLFLLTKRLFDSFYVLQFIQATIVNVAVCYMVQKYTKRIFIFLILYFTWYYFLFNTEVMREGMAISCCIFGMEAYMKGSKKIFALLLAVGLSFHISALIIAFFPLTDFIKIHISWKILLFATVASFVTWVLSDLVLVKIILMVLGTVGAMAKKITYYFSLASTIFGFIRNCITYLIFPYIIMYFSYLWEPSEEIKRKKHTIITFYILIAILASAIPPFARFRNYIAPFYLAMFADFAYMLFRRKQHLIIRTGTLVGTLFLIALTQFSYIQATKTRFYQYYYPYTSIVNKEKNIVDIRKVMHSETSQQEATEKNQRDVKD